MKLSPAMQYDLAREEFKRFDLSKLQLKAQLQRTARRVLLCGDRNWNNIIAIKRELRLCRSLRVLMHGKCRGADELGGHEADKLEDVDVLEFPAQWDLYGKVAGPIRNRQMLWEGRPNFVLAFHSNIERSTGTKDMVKAARSCGLIVKIIPS